MSNFKVKLSPPTQDFVLKNTTVTQTRLDRLNDVVEEDSAKVDGAVLIYHASSDTYVLRDILTYDEDTGAFRMDGGSEFN